MILNLASATTGNERCIIASCLPTFIPIIRASLANAVHEPVVKSCNRVPTAKITSARSAIVLALSEPVTPRGPILSL